MFHKDDNDDADAKQLKNPHDEAYRYTNLQEPAKQLNNPRDGAYRYADLQEQADRYANLLVAPPADREKQGWSFRPVFGATYRFGPRRILVEDWGNSRDWKMAGAMDLPKPTKRGATFNQALQLLYDALPAKRPYRNYMVSKEDVAEGRLACICWDGSCVFFSYSKTQALPEPDKRSDNNPPPARDILVGDREDWLRSGAVFVKRSNISTTDRLFKFPANLVPSYPFEYFTS
jgi:hypothetical protein